MDLRPKACLGINGHYCPRIPRPPRHAYGWKAMEEEMASSDNEQEELMEVDEPDREAGEDVPEDTEDQEESKDAPPAPEGEGDDDKEAPPARRASAAPSTASIPSNRLAVREEYLTAQHYDIVPTMAAPMGTSINCMAITSNQRFWMTGGSDGYIRKHDGIATINGKLQLTVAQRHPFVDSVVKAGVLMSYFANEEPANTNSRTEEKVLSPVYSLAIHSDALWILSGLESGGINLSSVRHDEGKRIATLKEKGHTNAVSVLQLAPDERSVLSGSWDKTCLDWDLNNGQVIRRFDASGGQISAIELRPMKAAPIPAAASEFDIKSDTFQSNNAKPPVPLFWETQKSEETKDSLASDAGALTTEPVPTEATGSPEHESLFGSPAGSLFGDNDTIGGGGGGTFGDDDDEFSRAMEEPLETDSASAFPPADVEMAGTAPAEASATEPVLTGENQPGQTADQLNPRPATAESTQDDSMDVDPPLTEPPTTTTTEHTAATISAPTTSDPENQKVPPSSQPDTTTATNNDPPPSQSTPPPFRSMVLDNPRPISQAGFSEANPDVFLAAAIDGTIRIWDKRVPNPIARINNRRGGPPPWLMGACWSLDGNFIYAGRRNGTVEEFSIHKASSTWQPERTLKLPNGSGPVSCVRPMANGRHLICASHDILRLYDLSETPTFKHSKVPFTIIPGPPRAGVISSLYVDPTSRIMISTAGTRGWEGHSTECLIGYEISPSKP
ncbi:WD40-repeat-containing domain protein [Podospora fimiseda]|uniref:WD40-repeat-containing domain protein n=1 Tax=Podospora fimiseda TaxID=252190 RepID=A0AAN7BX35_9PEZI|nr:WD40-repeat-containing domain protein [Podospora fimiseda]